MQGPYDQFLLFGDSLTQQSCSQAEGFAFTPALQDGMTTEHSLTFFCEKYPYESRAPACVFSRILTVRCAFQRSSDGWMSSIGVSRYGTHLC